MTDQAVKAKPDTTIVYLLYYASLIFSAWLEEGPVKIS
jgi:hypothetical protein